MVTFASIIDPDFACTSRIVVRVTKHERTIYRICANRGHPDRANEVAQINHVRDVYKSARRARDHPAGISRATFNFDVFFQDGKRAAIKDGYAMFETVDRYNEKGITHFTGYNPMAMDIPVHFEGYTRDLGAGAAIEGDIRALERMAGRGSGYPGAAHGPPAIIRVTVTNAGKTIPLVPPLISVEPGREHEDRHPVAHQRDRLGRGRALRRPGQPHPPDRDGALFEHTPITLLSTASQRGKAALK